MVLANAAGDTFVFDVLTAPSLLHTEAPLAQLLVSNAVVKIAHDCRNLVAALIHQFHVLPLGLYDTQIAARKYTGANQQEVRWS